MTKEKMICSQCHLEKPLGAFHRRPDRPAGRHYVCRACISRGLRVDPLPPPSLSATEMAYIAGMVDGEGSISIVGNPYWALRVSVYNTHRGVLEWIQHRLGGKIYEMHPRTDRHKAAYYWLLTTRQALALLKVLTPFLIIKSDHALIAIALFERMWSAKNEARDTGSKISTVREDPALLALFAKLKRLNRRGPP